MAFNKMFVMIPVMLAARKLNGEDPVTVYWLRVAYACIQTLCLLMVAYTYLQAQAVAALYTKEMVYVPPPPTPFADASAKKKYTEISYSAQVLSAARSLVISTIFGMIVTLGLHYYKGVVVGLAIQTILAPVNMMENALVKALIVKGRIQPQDKLFDEKGRHELSLDDHVVDDQGRAIAIVPTSSNSSNNNNKSNAIQDSSSSAAGPTAAAAAASSSPSSSPSSSLEEVLLDTWDEGAKAELGPLMAMINADNCNTATLELGWTPLMVLAGLGAPGTASAIRQVVALGGDPTRVDGEGWTALHWACFHGSVEGAKALLGHAALEQMMAAKDRDGKTPLDHAKAEGNLSVANLLLLRNEGQSSTTTTTTTTTPNNKDDDDDDDDDNKPIQLKTKSKADGLRKRK